jgi:hypothetical protein
MNLIRLRPSTMPRAIGGARIGPCAACEKPIGGGSEYVHLYGEAFHRDCAFYRSRGRGKRSRERAA